MIKRHLCDLKCTIVLGGEDNVKATIEPLNHIALDSQCSFFKLAMRSNAKAAMSEPMDVNPSTKLWKKLTKVLMVYL